MDSSGTALPQAEVPGKAPTTTGLKAEQGQVVPVRAALNDVPDN